MLVDYYGSDGDVEGFTNVFNSGPEFVVDFLIDLVVPQESRHVYLIGADWSLFTEGIE